MWIRTGSSKSKERMNRSISTVTVADGLAFAPDFSGYLHCFDAKTGKLYWTHDTEAAMWGSPMIADGKVFLCNEDGDVNIYPLSKTLDPDKDHHRRTTWEAPPTVPRCTPTVRFTS